MLALASAKNALVFGDDGQGVDDKYGIVMGILPYEESALDPWISEKTVRLHYFKHHRGYYTILKAYIHSHPEYQKQTLEELIKANQAGIQLDETIFDMAVLLYNHNHYWQSLKPGGGGAPRGVVGKLIDDAYGSYGAFRSKFIEESQKLGVGWVWVVRKDKAISVYRSEYRDTPLLMGYQPLLAIDVWEHAYYLDYQNERGKYVEAVLDHLLNWERAEKMLAENVSAH